MAPLDDEGTVRLDETALDSHSNGGTDTPKLTETASRSISPGASALLASTSPVHHRVHDDRSGGGGGGSSPEETAELPQHTQEMLAKLNARIADLSGQVTSLNGKLVQSYNRVGGLEDDLHARTAETGTLRRDVEKLEGQRKEWEDKYEGGLLVEKDHVQQELTRMMDQVIQETASRGKAVSDKEQIEKELEQLSSQLFQEANTMVAVERMARLRSEKKMEQLEQNLKDTEAMMAGQGEQMRGLGSKLEELEKERDELRHQMDDLANTSTISIVSEPESMAGTSFASSSGFPSSFSPEQPLPSTALVPSTPGGPYPRPTANIPHPLQYLSLDCQPYFEFVVFHKGHGPYTSEHNEPTRGPTRWGRGALRLGDQRLCCSLRPGDDAGRAARLHLGKQVLRPARKAGAGRSAVRGTPPLTVLYLSLHQAHSRRGHLSDPPPR